MSNLIDSKPRKFKALTNIFLILILSIVAYFIFLMFYFPVKQLSVFNKEYSDTLLFKGEEKEIIRDDSIASLKIKEAFLQSRIIMAKSDSISFSVDLIDSLLLLEVKGVVVLESKIQTIAKSRFFSRVDNEALIKYLSEPFIVSEKSATIEKEPIVFKKAPKDTIEAARQVFKPDTLANEIICINIAFDKNLILEISQSEEKPEFQNLNYLIKKRSWNLIQVVKNSILFKEPYYTPKIILELPKKDVKSIYRALPFRTQMSLIF